jgi:hypothetical protein
MAGWSLPILAAVSLASCKTPETLCVALSGLNRLTITTEPGTNGGLATEIDLVFVTDKKLYKTIGEMKARDYFTQREQMVRDFSDPLQDQKLRAGADAAADRLQDWAPLQSRRRSAVRQLQQR